MYMYIKVICRAAMEVMYSMQRGCWINVYNTNWVLADYKHSLIK